MNNSIQVLCLLVLVWQVHAKSVWHEGCRGCDDGDSGGEYMFDLCQYPVGNSYTEIRLTDRETCDNNVTFLQEMYLMTGDELRNVRKLVENMRKGRCERQLRKLDKQQLDDVISIRTTTNTRHLDKITSTYFDMTTQMHLVELVRNKLVTSMKDCCLRSHNKRYLSLNIGMLQQWFHLQRRCGDVVDEINCGVGIHIDLNGPVGCDRIMDILYLLLKKTENILERSKSVLHRWIKKLR